MARVPASISSRPTRILRRVDFPAPLGPIKPMRSPSRMSNERSLNNGRTPKVLVKPCTLKSTLMRNPRRQLPSGKPETIPCTIANMAILRHAGQPLFPDTPRPRGHTPPVTSDEFLMKPSDDQTFREPRKRNARKERMTYGQFHKLEDCR